MIHKTGRSMSRTISSRSFMWGSLSALKICVVGLELVKISTVINKIHLHLQVVEKKDLLCSSYFDKKFPLKRSQSRSDKSVLYRLCIHSWCKGSLFWWQIKSRTKEGMSLFNQLPSKFFATNFDYKKSLIFEKKKKIGKGKLFLFNKERR